MSEQEKIGVEPEQKKPSSFIDHLESFRTHLIRICIGVLICVVAVFVFKDWVFNELIFPPTKGDFITYRWLCELSTNLGVEDSYYCNFDLPFTLISTQMSGQFSTHLWVSFILGAIIAFPYILFESWRFIRPALYPQEVKNVSSVFYYSFFLLLLGIFFGYYLISPISVLFFGTYSVSAEVQNTFQLNSYISTISSVIIASGILFQIPTIIYLLAKLGLITPDFLRKHRKHAIVIIFVLSAIITPPDVGSQILVSIPIILLYQIGIWISVRVHKKRMKNEN